MTSWEMVAAGTGTAGEGLEEPTAGTRASVTAPQ